MNPFAYFIECYRIFCELIFASLDESEVRALRQCHNQNAYRLDRVEKSLRDSGISI